MKRTSTIRSIACTMVVQAAFVLSGCTTADESDSAKTQSASKVAERGPVKVIVEVDPARPALSDEPTLTLTIDHETGVTVEKPPFGESLGEFLIRDFREPLPETRGEREIVRQVYTLEPTIAGTLTVAPIAVRFQDAAGDDHVIETEPLSIEVTTIVGDEAPSLDNLRPATGPMELPREPISASTWLILGGILTAIAALVAWLWYRSLRPELVIPPTPEELAAQELRTLVDRKLSETDIKEFYVELTGVVRRYIERTKDVAAPEQTTDEFLREITSRSDFTLDERQRLREFLESADLVKYAGSRPDGNAVEQSLERARGFIQTPRSAPEVAA